MSPAEQPDRSGVFQAVLSAASRIDPQASWDRYSSLGAGSAPFFLAEPATFSDAQNTVRTALKLGMRTFPLGNGTNLVGSDSGLHDLVFLKLPLHSEFGKLELLPDGRVCAGAACSLLNVIRFAADHSLGGASALCGIPGTLGGALAMNAGAMGKSLSDFLVSAKGILLEDDARETVYTREELHLSYRNSPVIRGKVLVTELILRFLPVDPEEENGRIAAELARRSRAPKGRSAGSVFRNPSPERPAGKLLEEANCKCLRYGAYAVSEAHANWIVKAEKDLPGKESDVAALVGEMIRRVKGKYNTVLEPEVRFVKMESVKEENAPLKVLVLKGGVSSEREVSLESGKAVADALREAGYEVREYDIRELAVTPEMREWADVVWPVLHGGYGEDGRIQKMLEEAGIRFVGSGSAACALIMDKVASKKRMDKFGIPNAKYTVLTKRTETIPAGFSLPLIVKPAAEGSTFGITLAETEADWKKAMDLVFQYGNTALVEEFFKGVETTVGIVDGKPLPVVEIRYAGKIYDYDAKYTHALGDTEYLCPPRTLPEELQKKIQAAALKFYEISGAEEILRVDVMASPEDGTICVLEGNSIPGCTANSLVPKAARAAGISFPQLCSRLVQAAARRRKQPSSDACARPV